MVGSDEEDVNPHTYLQSQSEPQPREMHMGRTQIPVAAVGQEAYDAIESIAAKAKAKTDDGR